MGSLKSEKSESVFQAQESRILAEPEREIDENSLECFISQNEL